MDTNISTQVATETAMPAASGQDAAALAASITASITARRFEQQERELLLKVDRRPAGARRTSQQPQPQEQRQEQRELLPTPVFPGTITSYPEAAVVSLPWVMGQMFSLVWMLAIRTAEGALWGVDTILPSAGRVEQLKAGRCPFAVGGGQVVIPIAALVPGESWVLVAAVQTAAGDAFFQLPLRLVDAAGKIVEEGERQGAAYRYGVPSMVPEPALAVQAFGGRAGERLAELFGETYPQTFAELKLAGLRPVHPITHYGVGDQLKFEEQALQRLLAPQMWGLLVSWTNAMFEQSSGWYPDSDNRELVQVVDKDRMPPVSKVRPVQRTGQRHAAHFISGPVEDAEKMPRPMVARAAFRQLRNLAEARERIAKFVG